MYVYVIFSCFYFVILDCLLVGFDIREIMKFILLEEIFFEIYVVFFDVILYELKMKMNFM